MTMAHSHSSRRIDVASLALLVVGLAFGAWSYWLIENHGANPLLIAPSVVAATIGLVNITKREAPRR